MILSRPFKQPLPQPLPLMIRLAEQLMLLLMTLLKLLEIRQQDNGGQLTLIYNCPWLLTRLVRLRMVIILILV